MLSNSVDFPFLVVFPDRIVKHSSRFETSKVYQNRRCMNSTISASLHIISLIKSFQRFTACGFNGFVQSTGATFVHKSLILC